MTLISQRLHNHYLAQEKFTTPEDVVRWFGAVQAQDFVYSKWALGQGMNQTSETQVEADY